MVNFRQSSFAGGIISPELLGRSDQSRYAIGLLTCENAWITRYGALENRPGTKYVATATNPTQPNRLVKNVFNNETSYLLEFSDGLVAVYRNGARVSTVGAPSWSNATAYVIGNVVTYSGSTYAAKQSGTNHQPDVTPTYWLPLSGNLLSIPSAILQAMLGDFQTVQQNDVMTIVEQGVYPQVLTRFSDTHWTFEPFSQETDISLPRGTISVCAGVGANTGNKFFVSPSEVTATGGNTALVQSSYVVLGKNGGGFSSWSYPATATGGVDGSNHIVIEWDDFPAATNGFELYRRVDATSGSGPYYGLIGTAAAGATTFTDTNLPATTVLAGLSGDQLLAAYCITAIDDATGFEGLPSYISSCLCKAPTTANPNLVQWNPVAGKSRYRIYKSENGVFGFIGESTPGGSASYVSFSTATIGGSVFADTNIIPDTAIQPPTALTLFATSDDYPAVVGYYQQRLAFANTINVPTQVNMSRVGGFANFNVSTPIQDDDAVSFTIAGQRNESVQHLVDLGKLIIHTAGSEFVATGNQAGSISPLSIGLVRQGSAGSSAIPPLTLGNTDIFVQARGGFLRDLRYEIQSTSFAGKDLTIFAPDLLANRTIVSMDWQQIPHAIIWCALDDGTLLGLTYIREQDIWAWHEHDLGGSVEQVCTVPESTEDVVYLTVKRVINGSTTRYIERLTNRAFETIDDAWFVDCGLSYDGRNTGGTTMTLTTGAGWTPQDDLTLAASAGYFVSGDVGNAIVLHQIADGTTYDGDTRIPAGTITDRVTLDIIAYTDTQHVTVQSDKDVPTWARVALTTWGKAQDEFSGIDHLEGQSLSILGDGNVIADPLDPAYPLITVSGGSFSIPEPALVVTAGLPIDMRGQTLPLENAQGETIINKRITVREVCPIFYSSRGGSFGQDFDHLQPWEQRQQEAWSDPVSTFTGPMRLAVQGNWGETGQVCWRQTNPIPFSMSAIVVTADIGN